MTETTTETETDDEQLADQRRTGTDSVQAETGSDPAGESLPIDGAETDGDAAGTSGTGGDATGASETDLRSTEIWRYLVWGALGVCSLLALFAVVQFYGSVTDAIDLWIEPRYQPLMHAAFNLVVLLGSLVGVSLLVRELS